MDTISGASEADALRVFELVYQRHKFEIETVTMDDKVPYFAKRGDRHLVVTCRDHPSGVPLRISVIASEPQLALANAIITFNNCWNSGPSGEDVTKYRQEYPEARAASGESQAA